MRAMRPTSSALTVSSTGTSSSSVRARLKSSNCSTITSHATVNRCLQKVIVNSSNCRLDQQRGEAGKRFSAEERLASRLDVRGGRRQHPCRNLETLAYWVEN